jgi:hypothetical protein
MNKSNIFNRQPPAGDFIPEHPAQQQSSPLFPKEYKFFNRRLQLIIFVAHG